MKAKKLASSPQRKSAGGRFSYAKGGKVDPHDYSDRFNTPLTPQEERAFREWAGPKVKDLYDYDLKGFWKSGATLDERAHGVDLFKKPNHPTFSDQSQYHTPETPGGNWSETEEGQTVFTPSKYNLANMPLPELKRYFDAVEPTALINVDPRTTEEAEE